MAASLLDVVDWDNLEGVDIPIAVSVLAQATQERYNIATVKKTGGMRTRLLSPGGTIPTANRNKFPYKSNTPIFTVNEGDPLIDFTSEVATLFRDMVTLYSDIEKWDDADTNSEINGNLYLLGSAADAPGTYDNRLFEITGYTDYPDLSVYAIEEVKKWYDMLIVFKHIYRQSGTDPSATSDDYVIYDGVFDVEADAIATANQDGAQYFSDPQLVPVDSDIPIADTSVYDAFEDANVALFGTTPDSFDDSTDSGTYPPPASTGFGFGTIVYDMRARRDSSSEYVSWLNALQITYVADWTDSRASIGFTGRPLSYKNQCRATHSSSSSVPSFTPVITYPASTTANAERYYTTNVVTQVGEKDKIAVDHLLSEISVPTALSAFTGSNQSVTGSIGLYSSTSAASFGRTHFLEFWDGDGGFEYYTT